VITGTPSSNCMHFSYLPLGLRTLYTSTIIVLSMGYLFAMIHVFESHAGRDGNAMLSVDDLIIAYSGSKSDTQLESALKGPMASMLPTNERDEIIAWVRSGASQEDFSKIEPVINSRCSSCHDGSNPHVPTLTGFDNIVKTVKMDTGMDIFTLVRVSHIHLFGITFIFFIMGSIFCHSYLKHKWMKCLILALPFLSILLDIGSWYLTKLYSPFAYIVLASGGVMGLCFAVQAVISFYQMWWFTLPEGIEDAV
jgi:hypothetical protein